MVSKRTSTRESASVHPVESALGELNARSTAKSSICHAGDNELKASLSHS